MVTSEFQELFSRWCNNQTNPEEEQKLALFFATRDAEADLTPAMESIWYATTPSPLAQETDSRKLAQYLTEHTTPVLQTRPRVEQLFRWKYAAAVIVLVVVGWLTNKYSRPDKMEDEVAATAPIMPGKDGAILTLADGSTLVLDSLANGIVANQNGATVILKNGQLQYDRANNSTTTTTYNTVTTPKGRQFNIQLPDGTRVWLNAESSIHYPTQFFKERSVKITGEVYFEVKKDKSKPFLVKINDHTEIDVLGTRFNVNAYKDETTINATLIDGSIRVKNARTEVLLQPGEQAQITEKIKIVKNANTEQEMAWKNGLFNFHGKSLEEVMRQLVRWYDIEVVYEKGIPNITFGGEMTKSILLSDILVALEKSEVHFRMEGRRLIVLP